MAVPAPERGGQPVWAPDVATPPTWSLILLTHPVAATKLSVTCPTCSGSDPPWEASACSVFGAVQRVIDLIKEGFRAAGGDFNAGRELPSLFGSLGVEPRLDAHVVALSPGHPYLRLPLQFATSLRPRLETLIGKADLDDLVQQAKLELSRTGTWGTTFTLIQAYASLSA